MLVNIIVAGGGKYIPTILMKEGSSKYLDSIFLPYSKEATLEILGLKTTKYKFVSKEFIYQGLASLKEKTKRPEWNEPLTVVFASCSLFYEGQREDRKNCFVVGYFIIRPDGQISESVVTESDISEISNREEQEKFIAEYIVSTTLDMSL